MEIGYLFLFLSDDEPLNDKPYAMDLLHSAITYHVT